jgi:F-type H+-transporting ATPase subunit b
MSNVNTSEAHASVPGVSDMIQQLPSDVMQVSDKMILLTWLAFGIAAFSLHKLLWKPILRAVAGRERSISDALEGAEQARRALADSEARRQETAARAAEEARAVADRASREAADALVRADREARALAQRRMDEAARAIEAEQRKAFEAVRRASAAQLCEAFERFVRQELTEEQKRAYQRDILGEVRV